MKVQIVYSDEVVTIGSVLFDYQELIKQAYSVTNDSDMAKAFADTILELANDSHFNYGFFEIINGIPVYNSITEATIQYVPLVNKVAMDSDTIEQYKKFVHNINTQVEKLIQQQMWYNELGR